MSLAVAVLVFVFFQSLGSSCYSMPMPPGAGTSISSLCLEGSAPCNQTPCEDLSCWSGARRNAYQNRRIGLSQTREHRLCGMDINGRSARDELASSVARLALGQALHRASILSAHLQSNSVLNL